MVFISLLQSSIRRAIKKKRENKKDASQSPSPLVYAVHSNGGRTAAFPPLILGFLPVRWRLFPSERGPVHHDSHQQEAAALHFHCHGTSFMIFRSLLTIWQASLRCSIQLLRWLLLKRVHSFARHPPQLCSLAQTGENEGVQSSEASSTTRMTTSPFSHHPSWQNL